MSRQPERRTTATATAATAESAACAASANRLRYWSPITFFTHLASLRPPRSVGAQHLAYFHLSLFLVFLRSPAWPVSDPSLSAVGCFARPLTFCVSTGFPTLTHFWLALLSHFACPFVPALLASLPSSSSFSTFSTIEQSCSRLDIDPCG